MAQSLLAYYCFNDNSVSSVKDFSTNERHSSSVTGLTIGTDSLAIGKVGIFNGTSTNVNFGNVSSLNGLTNFSLVVKFKMAALNNVQIISIRASNHILEITAANKIQITITTGISNVLLGTNVLAKDIWYKTIITWNGATGSLKIYLDELETVDSSENPTGTMPTNTNSLLIGYDGAGKYLNGKIEMISYYNKVLSDNEIMTVFESPSGIKTEVTDAKLKTGDLILNNAGGRETAIWYEEFDERLFNDRDDHLFNDKELIIFPN